MSRILFFVPHPLEDAGYRYRVQQFLPYLQAAGHECIVWPFSTNRLYRALRSPGKLSEKILHTLYSTGRRVAQVIDLARFDLIVIQREVFPFLTPAMESWILFRHPRVVFAFDDAVYAGQPHVAELNHPMLYKLKYGRGIETVMRRSIHVIAGNRILAEYARRFNSHVTVVPTVVDCERYQWREQRYPQTVTIGWVGSRSTVEYLRTMEPVLKRVAEANPGKVRFRLIGAPEYKPDLVNCESLPFRLDEELENLAAIDIGLMPLPDNEWTRGKCAFKAIQYMASGAVTIASPVGITGDVIQHGVNGWLAATNEEWFQGLTSLVHDSAKRQRLAAAARGTVRASYSLQVWGPKFADLVSELLHSRTVAKWTGAFASDTQ